MNYLVPWKNVTVVVDSGAAENVMPKSMFPEIYTEETETSKNGKGSKDQERSTSRTMDSRSCPSELLKVCTQEHVAGCKCEKASCVGISQHPIWKRRVNREE